MAQITGQLTFDINSGKFWITDEEHAPLTSLEFGDEFEVKIGEEWQKTAFEITSGPDGDLQFKLKGTNLSGMLDGAEVRK
ncbi:MAG: DUF5348 domain-containing protein [Treponema sp.]|nr:DUF5348 domain-containing protein [Candidatus Treponema equifaecale]